MNRSYPPSPKFAASRANDESSLDDYEEAFLDVEDGEIEFSSDHPLNPFHTPLQGSESRASSVATPDWEEPESWMANSESFPASTPGSSCGASPLLTGTSSQGISPNINHNCEQAFPFAIPEDPDQSLSSISDVLQVEKDFMEYVMSFPLGTSPSVLPQLLPARKAQNDSNNPKIGLDHLDNLCKLMEQLSDLKEANIKLKRRVQYLEDIKTLHEIHKEMVGERKLYSSGLSEDDVQQLKNQFEDTREDPELSEESQTYLEPPSQGLYRSKTTNQVGSAGDYKDHKSRSATANKEKRERSKSVGHPGGHPKTKKRPSRWSKVKEVLGIERTEEASTAGEGENWDSKEERRDLNRISRKDSDHAKGYKLSSSRSHTNVLSSRSFSEAERQCTTPVVVKKSGTLDSRTAHNVLDRYEKEEVGAKKSPKSPWGKMKTMIQIRRDTRHNQKSESSSSSPRDAKAGKLTSGPTEPVNGHAVARRTQRNNHRSSYQEGLSVQNSDYEMQNGGSCETRTGRHQRLDPPEQQYRHRQKQSPLKHGHRKTSASQQESDSTYKAKELSTQQKGRTEDSCEKEYGSKETIAKENGKRKKSKPRPPPLDYLADQDQLVGSAEEAERVLAGASPQTQRKWMWAKVKDVLKGKKEDEGGQIGMLVPSSPSSVAECLTFDFDEEKAKLEESSQSPTEPPMLPCSPSATVTVLLRELQQNLSDDFNKKLEEWQRCRTEGIHKGVAQSPEVERKDSFGRIRKVSKTEKKLSSADKISKSSYHIPKKDLSWLEKEQQKVDREIIRLSKEKQKFEKRASRLQQLRETMVEGDGQKKEVLVKTSAGEFRFEGISDAFTRKLYEWETKKGVNPELSTIALLDESLKPPSESPAESVRPSPEPPKGCFQVSRASSEPDLSFTQKENSGQATRSKSGDTLLSGDKEIVANLEEDSSNNHQQGSRDALPPADENYYSLLEENMYLLDQLKEKEDICSHLQNELDRLDNRTEKNNRTHQEEMEKYRQKLWEIHMSRPRDLQGSLHLISELKSRIEELQNCSDKLKSDREKLEESFRYHSSQQARLADDLIRKVRELQDTGMSSGFSRGGHRRKWRKMLKCDPTSISRIHELSTKLLQQARSVEELLLERTRQVCHLRWELLHRDMSAVLLQAALHRVTSQGEPAAILPAAWNKRRTRFGNVKAWSVDATMGRPSQELLSEECIRHLSLSPYKEWTHIDFSPSDLMATAHEIKRETLRLSVAIRPDGMSDSEEKKSATCSADSEVASYDTGSAFNSRSSSFSSGGCGSGLRGSHSDTRLYERRASLCRLRRHSSSSCAETSDSSSLQDNGEMLRHRNLGSGRRAWRQRWRSLDNVSSSCSSRSSVLEEDFGKAHWRSAKTSSRCEPLMIEEVPHSHLQQKYGSFKEVDEENEESRAGLSNSWGSQCLITPRPMHLTRISDTESDKSLPSRFGRVRSIEYTTSQASTSYQGASYLKSQIHYAEGDTSDLQLMNNDHDHSLEYEICANASYKSTTDGSMESLDKYETAIRDEELTFSDGKCELQRFNSSDEKVLETFQTFGDDSKQEAAAYASSVTNKDSSTSENCTFVHRERQTSGCSSMSEQSNASTPNSPDIRKFKYKVTKGFGHSPRLEYGKRESDRTSFKSFQSFIDCRTSDDVTRSDS